MSVKVKEIEDTWREMKFEDDDGSVVGLVQMDGKLYFNDGEYASMKGLTYLQALRLKNWLVDVLENWRHKQ